MTAFQIVVWGGRVKNGVIQHHRYMEEILLRKLKLRGLGRSTVFKFKSILLFH